MEQIPPNLPKRLRSTDSHSRLKAEYAKGQPRVLCQGCGYVPAMIEMQWSIVEVHHICRVADGGTDDPDNIVFICANCHRIAHFMFPQRGRLRLPPTRAQLLEALCDPVGYLEQQKRAVTEALRAAQAAEQDREREQKAAEGRRIAQQLIASQQRQRETREHARRLRQEEQKRKKELAQERLHSQQLLEAVRLRQRQQQQAAKAEADAMRVRQKERDFWNYAKALRYSETDAVFVPIRDRLA